MIRTVHDILIASPEVRARTTISDLHRSLVEKYDSLNHEHREEALWKQAALNAYPAKPTYQERKRFVGTEKRNRTNKNIMKYLEKNAKK